MTTSLYQPNRPVLYVAGPYTSDPVGNTRAACTLFHELFDMGYAPIIPHLSMFLDFVKPRSWEDWMIQSRSEIGPMEKPRQVREKSIARSASNAATGGGE